MKRASSILAAIALAACAAPSEAGPRSTAAEEAISDLAGLALAEANCAACHDVSGAGPSPMAAAPAFKDIASRYNTEVLREELIAGVHVGPGDMPTFTRSVDEVDALIAYLQFAHAAPAR